MKKATYNKNGSRQLVKTGWAQFDKQTNCITTGNAYCNTQYSSFVRPWAKRECNGYINPEGHLMDYDLSPFDRFNIPSYIKDILTDKDRKDSVILYMFFTTDTKERGGRINPFCWVVTDRDYKLLRYRVVAGYGESYRKREGAAREVLEYITK